MKQKISLQRRQRWDRLKKLKCSAHIPQAIECTVGEDDGIDEGVDGEEDNYQDLGLEV